MRICVVVPSVDHMATAGVRIRYQRLEPWLRAAGHELTLKLIDDMLPKSMGLFDVYLLCKCHDARSAVLAAELTARGIHVGADFFDDYYSQGDDSRFVHLRTWLRTIIKDLSFTLCSTPLMRASLQALAPRLPCHMVSDPFEAVDPGALALGVERKLERARTSRILDIGWFGIGDNPHFPVGISDLAAFAGGLTDFSRWGFTPRLAILTNRRALTPARLEMLGRLPLPHRLEEWSTEGERKLVAESYVCFLPVNAQRFSTVKSLNRGVTALTGGAQVLSAGYPLYAEMGEFVYRDVASVAEDILGARPKLRRETMASFLGLMGRMADPEGEAGGLTAFLSGLPARPKPATDPPLLGVIHGRHSTGAVHKYAQRLGHLSVPAAFAAVDLNYDIRVTRDANTGTAMLQLSHNAAQRLRSHLKGLVRPLTPAVGKLVSALPLQEDMANPFDPAQPEPINSDAVFIANYAAEIGRIEAIVRRHFDVTGVVLSEYASPFWSGDGRQAAPIAGAP